MKNSMRIFFLSLSMLTAVSGFAGTNQESEKQITVPVRPAVQVGTTALVFMKLLPMLSAAAKDFRHGTGYLSGDDSGRATSVLAMTIGAAALGATYYVSGQVADLVSPFLSNN